MKKKIGPWIIVLCLFLCGFTFTEFTSSEPLVYVHGEFIFFDQAPLVENGRLLLPIRAISERLGAKVVWDAKTQETILTKDQLVLTLKIGEKVIRIHDGRLIPLDVAPRTYEGRILLPLRAVIEALGYTLSWEPSTSTANIEEVGALILEGLGDTHANRPSRWAYISPIQQFSYKNEGLAYAYESNGKLIVQTPSRRLVLDQLYPLLGDVISDELGHFYVVWGLSNENSQTPIETLFISKYSPDGQFIKSVGFEGDSSPWGKDNSAKTQIPFDAGKSVSAIQNGILVNYHGKQRYDGHQSDQVVAVKIDDMTPYFQENNTYTGHSFNQSILYSKRSQDFLFASQGDAYPRGFRVNGMGGDYGNQSDVLFHFYLEANAAYNMWVVNETFAQLGGLVETSSGLALVGASAKSIGEKAKTETQNLFVQIFDPTQSQIDENKFIGGTLRSGYTSFDINDTQNRPLSPVTDYGVLWLTNDSKQNVVSPQVVVGNDQIIILWSTEKSSYYMVLSSNGAIVKPVTELGRIPLNSMEAPIFYKNAVHWVSVENGRLVKRMISLGPK